MQVSIEIGKEEIESVAEALVRVERERRAAWEPVIRYGIRVLEETIAALVQPGVAPGWPAQDESCDSKISADG